MNPVTPGTTINFEAGSPDDLLRPRWQVSITPQGELEIFTVGRRNGRIHILPSAVNYVTLQTVRAKGVSDE